MRVPDEAAANATLSERLKRWSRELNPPPGGAMPRRDAKPLRHLVRQEVFNQLRRRCRVRELPPLAVFPGLDRIAVPLGVIDDETGHPNHAEMTYVVAAATLRKARRIFEFGTFIGRTTLHFARMNPDARVWTLDLPREQNPWRFADRVGSYFAGTPEASRIQFLRADARTFDPAPYRQSMDFIWVDGDHAFDSVRQDTLNAFEMLAPGGAIFWHDFGPDSPELVSYIRTLTKRQPLFHLRRTSVLVHLDGIDPFEFTPHDIPFSKSTFRAPGDNATTSAIG
jgi:predicted O-methyltransferase YrrM